MPDESVTLTCIPADALVIDNEAKTVTVQPISVEQQTVKLMLTANDPGSECEPLEFDFTIRRFIPLMSVHWDYKTGSTGKTVFNYYETINGVKQLAEYYYEQTVGSYTEYAYYTDPDWYCPLCTVKVTSSNQRVLKVDDTTKRLLPCGNGETELTITATSPPSLSFPAGKTCTDTITVVVQGSPYTPITDVSIGCDQSVTDAGAFFDPANDTVTLKNDCHVKLIALLNDGSTLDQKSMNVTTEDGRNINIVSACDWSWTSSDASVAVVDQNGSVTSKGLGKAVITLTILDNGVKFTKTVNVFCTKDDPSVKIRGFRALNWIGYHAAVTFNADLSNGLSGTNVHWFIDGKDVGTSDSFTAEEAEKTFTVQAKYILGEKVIAASRVERVWVLSPFITRLVTWILGLFGRAV